MIASPRWHATNTDIPTEIWKKLVGEGVVFGCMQQLLIKPSYFWKAYTCDVDMAFGQAVANVWGADCIYLYNYMDKRLALLDEFTHSTAVNYEDGALFGLLKEIGSDCDREKHVRRVPITFDDFVNGYEAIISTLPMKMGSLSSVRISTGKITQGRKTFFIMQTEEKIMLEDIEVYMNGVKAEYISEHKEDANIVKGNIYSFAASLQTEEHVGVELCAKKFFVMTYAEILIE